MKKADISGLIVIVLFTLTAPIFSQDQNRIVVLDFEVQSNNPDYQYLGKGFAEFIAVDLASTMGIIIIDRNKRNEIIEEQKFSVSGLTDESSGVELGNMLSANYLVSGSIFDLFGELDVTMKLLNIEEGSVAATARAGGEPREYKNIIGELVNAIVISLDTGTASYQTPEPEVILDNDQADVVLASFSDAMDAVDRDDVATAKEKLQTVQNVDKTNEAAKYYLSKLFIASPKFNVELIYYVPSFNPAYLGFIQKDRLYTTFNFNPTPFHEEYPIVDGSHSNFNWILKEGLYYNYTQSKGEVGYYLPLGQNMGVGVEGAVGNISNIVRDMNYIQPKWEDPDDDYSRYIRSGAGSYGGRISLGLKLNTVFSLGISGYFYYLETNLGGDDGEGSPSSHNFGSAATLGFYLNLLEGALTIDSHATVPFIQEPYIDASILDSIVYKTAPYPGVIDFNIIGKVLGGRVFLSVKEVLEVYLSFGEDDRNGIASRTIPAVEWWPTDFMAVRAGGEYDFLSLDNSNTHGFGAMGGLSFRIGSIDVDANLTYMQRAFRFYPGYSAPDLALLVQVSLNGVSIKERK